MITTVGALTKRAKSHRGASTSSWGLTDEPRLAMFRCYVPPDSCTHVAAARGE